MFVLARSAAALAGVLFVLAGACAARAQDMSESQRLERCANNQIRLDSLQKQLNASPRAMSDEEIARARADLAAVRAYRMRERRRPADITNERDRRARNLDYDRMKEITHRYGLDLGVDLEPRHSGSPENFIGQLIDQAVAQRALRQQIEREMAMYRNNLLALRCGKSADASRASSDSFAGEWEGRTSDNRFRERWSITGSGGNYSVSGTYFDAGTGREVGSFGGSNVSFDGGHLKFHQAITRKPDPGWADTNEIDASLSGETLQFRHKWGSGGPLKRISGSAGQ